MNCETANRIPLENVLGIFNCRALKTHSQKKETWFENPIREETVSSFSVNSTKNTWYDFGSGIGGSVLDLIMERFSFDVSAALEWLDQNINSNMVSDIKRSPQNKEVYKKPIRYVFKNEREIYNYALKGYLEQRGIDVETAKCFVKEIRFLDTVTNKSFFSLGVKNLKGGYALRNSFGKTILGFNDLTYFKAEDSSESICVFEGLFDFLSYLMITGSKVLERDILLLNSQALAKRGFQHIAKLSHIKNIYLFLDNPRMDNLDSIENSKRAVSYFLNQDFNVFSANENYIKYSDVAEYWECERSKKTLEFSRLESLLFSQHAEN